MAFIIPVLAAAGIGVGVAGGLGLFGDKEDAVAKNTLVVDVSNSLKILSETLVTNSQSTAASFVNVNEATIVVDTGAVVNGNVETQQKIDLRAQVSGQIDSNVITEMSSKLVSDLKLAADQAAKATSDWFSTSKAAAENVTTIKNALEQAVTDRLSVTNYQQIRIDTFNKNDSTVVIRGVVNGDVKITQTIVADIIAINVINSIVNKTNEILQTSNSDIRVTQSSESTAKGLNSVIDSFVGGFTTSSIIAAVILCVIIVSLLVVALSPSGQKSINKASNAAAARYGGGGGFTAPRTM